jgi:hypothetical protein
MASAAALCVAVACHEIAGPGDENLRVPNAVAKTAGPPDPLTYTMSSAGYASVELVANNYPYPTWMVVKPNGPRFMLTAYGSALPASGTVGASGVAGGRNGCDFNANVSFGMVHNWFGACGAGAGWDTVIAQGQGFIRQGSFPLDYASVDNSDCPPHTSGTCHVQELTDISFTVWPYPALMVPVTASPGTVPFSSVEYQKVVFRTAPNPPTVVIGGVTHADTMTTTSWVYTAADGTLDGNMCNGGYPALTCSPYLHKSGRMVVKAFLGGWEQSSTISVQCLVTPLDSVLNDTTGDFAVRDSILKTRERANADSAPDAGFGIDHPGWVGGWQHETGVNVWQLPNGAGREIDTIRPNLSDACNLFWDVNPPVPGAILLGSFHVHETATDDPIYCLRKVQRRKDGPYTYVARSPTEAAQGRPVAHAAPDTAADNGDRKAANQLGKPVYVLTRDGRILKISPVADTTLPNPVSWYRVFGGTTTQQKCAWPPPKR